MFEARSRGVWRGVCILFAVTILGFMGLNWGKAGAPEPAPAAGKQAAAETAPPADQNYIGTKKCASCHFDHFSKWKKTKHSGTFTLLPEKYQADAKCLKCHTTGFGEPTGYKTTADNDLKGTSCEACHGPGSKHAEICKPFANQKPTPEQDKIARDSIWKILPTNSCITCHMVQGHHDSMTPPELRKKK
jgi:Cytochrome c554 and c-prime